jgi:hypothetical protein
MEEKESIGKNKSPKLIISAVVVLAVIIGSVCFGAYFYFKYKKAISNPNAAAQDEVKSITDKIGKFMDLPKEEIPSIATVTDTEKLKEQAFFQNARNGDKVLIYAKSGKAILYRPSLNKVIEAISMPSGSQTDSQSQNELAPAETSQINDVPVRAETVPAEEKDINIRVAIYNGTDIKGLAAQLADKIYGISGIKITEKTNAIKNYPNNIIIDLTGKNSETVQKIIDVVKGESGTLPDGEIKPDADILIIGGKN